MMLPAIASLVLLHRGAPEWAGASLAIAMLTKPQALLLAPILALGAWRTGGVRALVAAAVGGAITAGVIVLPYALVGALPNMWLAFGSFYARRDILSGYAANIWWIANYVLRAWNQIPRLGVTGAYLAPVRRIMAISTFQDYGLPNPRPFGTLLVLVGERLGPVADPARARPAAPRARRRVHRPRVLRAVGRRARASHDAGGSAPRARRGASAGAQAALLGHQPDRRAQHEPFLRHRPGTRMVAAARTAADRSQRPAVAGQHRGARVARPRARARGGRRLTSGRARTRAPRDPTCRDPPRRRKSTAGTRAASGRGRPTSARRRTAG